MKKFWIVFYSFGVSLIMLNNIGAQHRLSTQGKAIVNENQDTILLRGMGLGGWMVQEGYMLQTSSFANPQHEIRAKIEELIGASNTELFYDAWLNNHVRKSDIDSLKSWGFNSIRLPMHYNLFTLPIEEEPVTGEMTWLTKGFELTDSLISWCSQNEMYVILDLHAAPGGQGYDAGISDYDPSKPSLWESEENMDKMVALWKNLASRYSNEDWVAGYDLLNEPNWDLPGGTALRNLYREVTDSIRTVDPDHIIFIEGNWFANDFTGLTPPWDNNLVYSPHKYWSNNDKATMQWVLDLQNQYNVPLYLGESGENSNVWFRDAIKLLEDLNIGWAWWPMKKVESISGPLSVLKTSNYQTLLDHWNGNGNVTAEFAKNTLMELTENLKSENCVFQKDVVDAMFRQVATNETKAFDVLNIPGLVYATDYDLGVIGEAYFDIESGNYQVSTGNFTPWNTGWSYRNDGVDIERCDDNINTNGYNVGFLDTDEWMQYEVDIAISGVYDIHLRASSGGSGGRLHFESDGAAICPSFFIPPSGGWQNWETSIIQNVILDESDQKIRFYVDQAGFNISSFEFIESETDIQSLATEFVGAQTIDEYSIQMNTNKFLETPLNASISDFKIFVNGNEIPIISISSNADNNRIIQFDLDFILKSTDYITISYSGNQVIATDGTLLNTFNLENVKNTLEFVHQIPGRIEAEDYDFQLGVSLEDCTDIGGGQNIAFLDPGDYLDYEINITTSGNYEVDYRTAALFGNGQLKIQLIDREGNIEDLTTRTFSSTGGWQNWATTSETLQLPEGRYTMRVIITQSPFNLNWIDFNLSTSVNEQLNSDLSQIQIYPNPSHGEFNIAGKMPLKQSLQLELLNSKGKLITKGKINRTDFIDEQLSLNTEASGLYFLKLITEGGTYKTFKLVKL